MPIDLLAAASTVRAAAPSPPTTELGSGTTSGLRPITMPGPGGFLGSWAALVDEAEQIPDLRWAPYGQGAVAIYDKMRTDPQVHGLVAWGLMLPIRRRTYHVDPNGATERTATAFAQDLNLPIKDQPRETTGRTKGRFSHDDHLRHALLAPGAFGHMFFEQVGEIADGWWRMRKLAPRMPHSLERIEVDEHGDLSGIYQRGGGSGIRGGSVEIPVGRLAPYVWEREGSQWIGRSLLRAMYGPWLVKQRLVRVDAIKHERNGMGVPITRQTIPEVNPGAPADALRVAESIRAGEVAGASLPYGFDLSLQGVSGSLPDTMASIRYCDEAMAKALMMMFVNLDQNGSRALGDTLVDYFKLTQDTVADWYCDTTSMYVGEDYADWNDGPESGAPRIGYVTDDTEELSVADLVTAIDAGLVTVSEEDETAFRERYDLPVLEPGTRRPPAPATMDAGLVPGAPGQPVTDAQIAAAYNANQLRDDNGRWAKQGMHFASSDERSARKVPPAWTDVQIADSPSDALQVIGTDAKGKVQRTYSAEHTANQAAAKFERTRALDAVIADVDRRLAEDDSDAAAVLAVIRRMGLRPGSETDTGAKKQAYGATTLQARHVEVTDNTVRLRFVGKSGKDSDLSITDAEVAGIFASRLDGKAGSEQVFPGATDASLRAKLRTVAPGFKVKDLRTRLGTSIAHREVAGMPVPTTDKERKAAVKAVAERVSAALGNTPAVALSSYIDPAVFGPWNTVE